MKPPADDAELRRKAVIASQAVVNSILSAVMRAFLWMVAAAVLFGIGTLFVPSDYSAHSAHEPAWIASILNWIHRTEDSWINRAAKIPSNAGDEAIRKQNDIALAKIHSGPSPTPAKTTRHEP
jgi:hypothetical protein